METFDIIIAGGGAAGLSLAYHLLQSDLQDSSILIIDKDPKNQNDRTWCFWTDQAGPYDAILHHSWRQIRFTSPEWDRVILLGAFRYNMIRGLDYYQFTHAALSQSPHIQFLQGAIEAIQDQANGVQVTVNGQVYHGKYGFDSRISASDLQPQPARYHCLKQHFVGWQIETDQPVFDPHTPTLFDFRTPQNGAVRFMYILPDSPTHALVEYTLFSPNLLADQEYEDALDSYLKTVLCLSSYRILEREQGIIPMTDHPFARQAGLHLLNIGTRGGRVKPSTGYAFLRIQQDSAAIVNSLRKNGHPFDLPHPPSRYRLYDSILLQIMYRHPNDCSHIFTQMFKNNPPERIFRFLDERGPFSNDLALMASLPIYRFVQALIRLKLLHRL